MSAEPRTPDRPEHEKLRLHQDAAQTVGDFIEWLSEKGFVIATVEGESGKLVHAGKATEYWVADFLGIDIAAFYQEKESMLVWLRTEGLK